MLIHVFFQVWEVSAINFSNIFRLVFQTNPVNQTGKHNNLKNKVSPAPTGPRDQVVTMEMQATSSRVLPDQVSQMQVKVLQVFCILSWFFSWFNIQLVTINFWLFFRDWKMLVLTVNASILMFLCRDKSLELPLYYFATSLYQLFWLTFLNLFCKVCIFFVMCDTEVFAQLA